MKSIKTDIIIFSIFSFVVMLSSLVFFSYYIRDIFLKKEIDKAREFSHVVYYYRKYLSTIATKVNFSDNGYPFRCTPAYVTNQVAKMINKNENIILRQVSDRYRNSNDIPKKEEFQAIKFFKSKKNKEFYKIYDDKLFYAYPLYAEKSCLKCHGVPLKDVPAKLYKLLSKYYGNRAFNYKLGELRGIISITIPFSHTKKEIMKSFFIFGSIYVFLYLLGVIVLLFIWNRFEKSLKKFLNYYSSNDVEFFTEKVDYKEFNILKNSINDRVKLLKDAKEELYNKIFYNPLTNLVSRTRFNLDMENFNNQTLILLDIDNFKEINNYYGFEIGDKLIKEVSNRLKKLANNHSFDIYQLGIDEFALLFKECIDRTELQKMVKSIVEEVEKEYVIEDNPINIKFRAGISCEGFVEAEIALDFAKKRNKDIFFFVEAKIEKDDYKKHLEMLKKLKEALKEDRIVPFFQPIVDKDKNIVKYETLVRMIDEDNKVISPFFFLNVAKTSRLYLEITKRVIAKGIEKIKKHQVQLSFNLSLEDFEDDDIKSFILNEIKGYESFISFEVVESEDMREEKIVKEFLDILKEKGCEILIDDFGSGYSNFDYILELKPNCVKIDGSLIKDILTKNHNEVIVKTIVTFAKEIGIKTIAEYVENEEIFEKLKSLGVDYFQGYYFSPPLPDIKE